MTRDANDGGPDAAQALIARAGQAGRHWRERGVGQRLVVIAAFRARLASRAGELAAMIERRPAADTLTGEILPLLEACRWLERNAAMLLEPRRRRVRVGAWLRGMRVVIEREPYGTVLIVGPSNYPLMLPGVQALQALAAGNAVIVKPAPGARTVLERFAAMLGESGLPDGLLQIAGESIAAAETLLAGGVDRLIFTGSSEAGQIVLSQAAEVLVPATAELSGWDACLVLDSADTERAARMIAFALSFNDGRTCLAPRRILVSRARHDALVSRLAELLQASRPASFAAGALRSVAELVGDAIARGAGLAAGRLTAEGASGPMLVTGVTASMPLNSTEIFGPIALVTVVDDAADAVAKANAVPFRLGAIVFGGERAALEIAKRLDAGVVIINDAVVPAAHPAVPIAARGTSGYGATRGAEGLLELTRPKAVVTCRARRPFHLRPRFDSDGVLLGAYANLAYGRGFGSRACSALEALRAIRNRYNREKAS